MKPWTAVLAASIAVSSAGTPACERREVVPGETRTRSGELTDESRGGREPRPAELDRDGGERATSAAGAPRERDGAAADPRFDAGRLSIVGSAEERNRNLGLVPQSPLGAIDAALPLPQGGAGAVESPPLDRQREGAGQPGAGGAPYQ